jgi:hypothetical protein
MQGPEIREHVANIQRGSGHCGCDMRRKGHGDAHGKFMNSTHDYCRQFFKGGAYWDNHTYQKGSGLFGSIGHWFKKAAHTVQSIPLVRDAEHGLVKVGSKVLQGALEPAVDAVADGAVSLVGAPELARYLFPNELAVLWQMDGSVISSSLVWCSRCSGICHNPCNAFWDLFEYTDNCLL